MVRQLAGAMVVLSWTSSAFGAPEAPRDARASMSIAVAIATACEASGTAIAIAQREAARIWAGAGVDLRWTTADKLPYRSERSEWLVVRCVEGEAVRTPYDAPRVMTVAAIRFIDAEPTNTIGVSVGNARLMLENDARAVRDLDRRFAFHRDRRLGRMIGRAIAHEIGHFLGRSDAHTTSGLMKARHSVAAFTGDSLFSFAIDRAAFAQYVADARERRASTRVVSSCPGTARACGPSDPPVNLPAKPIAIPGAALSPREIGSWGVGVGS